NAERQLVQASLCWAASPLGKMPSLALAVLSRGTCRLMPLSLATRRACSRTAFLPPMKVPFLDLKAHHAPLRGHFKAAIAEVIDSGIFAGGPAVVDFEEAFAAYCKCDHAVG